MSRDRSATPSSAGRERSLSAKVRSLMRRYDIHPRKRFGQNFLVNRAVIESILESAELSSTDVVVEIGPGLGLLTSELASRSGLVLAVEIDRGCTRYSTELGGADNVICEYGYPRSEHTGAFGEIRRSCDKGQGGREPPLQYHDTGVDEADREQALTGSSCGPRSERGR